MMSQSSIRSPRNMKRESQPLITYDCSICMTINTSQLLELPCGHNLCLSCLHMICAHSALSCPFCRCRISTWLRHNPNYSKFIITRDIEPKTTTTTTKETILKQKRRGRIAKKTTIKPQQQQPKRRYQTSKLKPTIDDNGNIADDWLLARKIHYEQHEEFRYTYGRITRAMAEKMITS